MQNEFQENIVNEPDFAYEGKYSYADYLRWTIEERVELIKGKIFKMSPAPSCNHQQIVSTVLSTIYHYLKTKDSKVFTAPFDVRFPKKSKKDDEVFTVLQPDICIVCDLSKLDQRGCIGAPDLVVEILSAANNKKELKNKYEVYEESGVKEYWVISPQNQTFLAYKLSEAGKFIPTRLFVEGDIYCTELLPGFELNLEEVFSNLL